jgi:TRAP-type mannitol/chloroaromatic compound transport system substrate-binding protein
MKTRRREILVGVASAAVSIQTLPTPAIAEGVKEFTLVTSWPRGTRAVDTSVQRLARSITILSDGRLRVTVYPADALVRAFEVFDAVGAGAADMYHTDEVYFADKSPALNFFCAVPYGLTADELCSWIAFGGGQTLWVRSTHNSTSNH